MKPIFISLLAMTGGVLCGCATDHHEVAWAPVGPAPGQTVIADSHAILGSLVVYSAPEVNPELNSRDNYRQTYTDYTILTEQGGLVKYVHNDSGTLLQRPVPVKLPAGKYQVAAYANGYGSVTVPVIIASGQLTTVRLDRDLSLAR